MKNLLFLLTLHPSFSDKQLKVDAYEGDFHNILIIYFSEGIEINYWDIELLTDDESKLQ